MEHHDADAQMSSLKVSDIGELATYDPESGGIDRKTNVDLIVEDGKVVAVGDALRAHRRAGLRSPSRLNAISHCDP